MAQPSTEHWLTPQRNTGSHPAQYAVPIDEQGLDPALAVLRLSRRYSADRVEAASRLALAGRVRSPRYAHLKPILDTGQDQLAALGTPRPEPAEEGGYVRGADYYANGGAK